MVNSIGSSSLLLLLPILVSGKSLMAKVQPSINNTLEKGVETECKTCPYSLCTNVAWYTYSTNVTLTCWTSGTSIDNDTTWLKTTDGCYVTQYDLKLYNGTYETDLEYCGEDSEVENLTFDYTTVIYDSECNICPDNGDCAVQQYLSPDTDITVTCWTDAGSHVIGDTTWLKTTDNCYVNEQGLQDPANKDILDNCGPIGFIQLNYTTINRKRRASPSPVALADRPEPRKTGTSLSAKYLVNITVGEDWANCYSSPNSTTGDFVTRYRFDTEVWVQCWTEASDLTYWYETTDFCYVREPDFWQSLGDLADFPDCGLFTQNTSSDDQNDGSEDQEATPDQV